MATLNDLIKQAIGGSIPLTRTAKNAITNEVRRLLDLPENSGTKDDILIEAIEAGLRSRTSRYQERVRTTARRCARTIDVHNDGVGQCLTESLLDRWTLNGKPIGDYRGDEMAPFAAAQRAQGEGNFKVAEYYDFLGTADSELIRDAITPEALVGAIQETEQKYAGGVQVVAAIPAAV